MNRTITALFDDRDDADRARSRLADLGVSDVNITSQGQGYGDDLTSGTSSASTAVPTTGSTADLQSSDTVREVTDGDYDQDRDRARSGGGFWAGIKNFFSDDDRPTYEEGLRRGHFLLTAQVDDDLADEAVRILEESDAVDVDRRVEEWRSAGWTGTPASATTANTGYDADQANTLRSDTDTAIPIVEETLRVGKREVGRGGVRVRSYVVETPVNEQVNLHEEHVSVERRAVDQPLSAADGDLFRERTIEMTETAEEAVVSKEARVREELVINKEATERTETVSDTVRHTEVDIDDTRNAGGVTGEARGFTATDTTSTGSANTQGIDNGQGEGLDLIPGETVEERRRRLSASTGTEAGRDTGTGPGAGSL